MSGFLNEDAVEQYAIALLQGLGYAYLHGSVMAPGGSAEERTSFKDAVLVGRLRSALTRLNTGLPHSAIEDALRKAQHVGPVICFTARKGAQRSCERLLFFGLPIRRK